MPLSNVNGSTFLQTLLGTTNILRSERWLQSMKFAMSSKNGVSKLRKYQTLGSIDSSLCWKSIAEACRLIEIFAISCDRGNRATSWLASQWRWQDFFALHQHDSPYSVCSGYIIVDWWSIVVHYIVTQLLTFSLCCGRVCLRSIVSTLVAMHRQYPGCPG